MREREREDTGIDASACPCAHTHTSNRRRRPHLCTTYTPAHPRPRTLTLSHPHTRTPYPANEKHMNGKVCSICRGLQTPPLTSLTFEAGITHHTSSPRIPSPRITRLIYERTHVSLHRHASPRPATHLPPSPSPPSPATLPGELPMPHPSVLRALGRCDEGCLL